MNIIPKLTIKPSPFDDKDWVVSSIYSQIDLPEKIDYRANINTPRDQKEQGSCAAQSAACMKEWQEKRDVGYEGLMSPQFIYNNRENQDSEGMYCRDVMKILSNKGSCFEKDYPYGLIQNSNEIEYDIYEKAKRFKIKNYAQINTIEELKKALYLNGPCLIAFPTYNYTIRMWIPLPGDKPLGGHAMTVVGYDNDGFIIRNSWGIHWGLSGNCIYPYKDWGSHWEIWTTIDDKSYYQENIIKRFITPNELQEYRGEYFKNNNTRMTINYDASNIEINNFIYLWNSELNYWEDIDHLLYFLTIKINKTELVIQEYYEDSLIETFIFKINSSISEEEYKSEEEDISEDEYKSEEEDISEEEDKSEEEDIENDIKDNEQNTCYDKLRNFVGLK